MTNRLTVKLAWCVVPIASALVAWECATAVAMANQDTSPIKGTGVLELRGVVVDEQGEPVAGAIAAFVWNRQESPKATSDGQGRFALRVPRNGPVQWFSSLPLRVESKDGAKLGFLRFDGTDNPKDELRIVLKPAHTVDVHVVDANDRAVEGAQVEISEETTALAAGLTDASGHCRLRIPIDAHVFWVAALKDAVGFDFFENFRTFSPIIDEHLTPPSAVRLVLDGACEVKVQVTGMDGMPRPGVDVRPEWMLRPGKLSSIDMKAVLASNATTDAEGIAKFAWIPTAKAANNSVSFRQGDNHHWTRDRPTFNPNQPAQPLTMGVERMVKISGRVVDDKRRPVAGFRILAEGHASGFSSWKFFATTNDNGVYELEVPAACHFIIGGDDPNWSVWSRTGVVTVEGQSIRDIDFELRPVSLVRGVMKDTANGKPIAGARVVLREIGERFTEPDRGPEVEVLERETITNAEGRYEFRVGSGIYQAGAQYQMPATNGPQADFIRLGEADLAERDLQANARVTPRTITGRVIDALGAPVADLIVECRGESQFRAKTDAKGLFRGTLSGSKQFVFARSEALNQAAILDVPRDHSGELTVKLEPAAILRGRVIDDKDKPIARIQVYCEWGLPEEMQGRARNFYSGKQFYQYLATDEEGRFELRGVVVGSKATLSVPTDRAARASVDVEQAGELDVGDFVSRARTAP